MLDYTNDNNYPVDNYILASEMQLIHYYIQFHSKTFLVRADIHYPEAYPPVFDNFHIQRCIAKTIQYLNRHGYQPMYIWVREQNMSINPDKPIIHPHYHLIMLLNGQKTRSAGLVYDKLEEFWINTIGWKAPGLIHRCLIPVEDNPFLYGQMIYRNDGIPANVYRLMNYLAKPANKGEANDGLRNFGMSRLPDNTENLL